MHPEEDPAFFRKPLPAFPAFGSKKEKKAKAVGFFMQRRIHLSKVSHTFHIVFHAKSLFLHEKGFVCGKPVCCIPLHINFSTYGRIVDFQPLFKEKMWKT